MPAPDLGDVLLNDVMEVTFEGRLFSQTILTTFHYAATAVAVAPPTRWDEYNKFDNVFNDVAGLTALFCQHISIDYELVTVRYQYLQPQRMAYRRFSSNTPGGVNVPTTTANIACSIERRSGFVGRHGVGRIQLPAPPTDTVGAGLFDVLFTNNLATLCAAIPANVITAAPAVTWTPVLYSVLDTDPVTWFVSSVVSADPKPEIRTMRRRTVGLGI